MIDKIFIELTQEHKKYVAKIVLYLIYCHYSKKKDSWE